MGKKGDLLEGGFSGPAIVPGKPEQSLLYQMLADGRMPRGGRRFTPAELRTVADWIRSGAPARDPGSGHWAFRPPTVTPAPAVKAASRVRNEVDRYLLAALEAKGLSFSPEADRRTLLRRVTFDLIGLPPTPQEMDDFFADTRPDAYERVVDRLLADPRYGERWARHWLDTAGYADSEGVLQEDRVRPNAWRYRDYVIRSLNADKPYNRFLQEQLAGDELVGYPNVKEYTPEVIETITATGFLRTAVDATRDDFNSHQYGEYQYRMLHDTQTIVASTVLGLTVQCSRCHNHKFEALTQRDYYRMQALFTGGVRPRGTLLSTAKRQIIAATPAEQQKAREVNAEVDAALATLTAREKTLLREAALNFLDRDVPDAERPALREALLADEAKRTAPQKALLAKYPAVSAPKPAAIREVDAAAATELEQIPARRNEAQARRITHLQIRAFYDQDATPPPTPLLIRGEWLKPGDPVEPGVWTQLEDPARPFRVDAAAGATAGTTGRRKAFAEWVTRPDHPLTGRVIVNRVWSHHFGLGLVPSTDNLGRSGDKPSNRRLLDFLATRFTDSSTQGLNWSLKKLHHLILTSTAYRQSSASPPPAPQAMPSPGARASRPQPPLVDRLNTGHQPTRTQNPHSAFRIPQLVDPENRLLWRQRPRRLEAEAIRDAMLAVSGSLDTKMFGEPIDLAVRGTGEVAANGEEGRGRRSIYLLVRRTTPVTLLNVFDAPVMETNCVRRPSSTTASQALALMNGSFITSRARAFASLIVDGADSVGDAALIPRAYRAALSRNPSAAEQAATEQFLREQQPRYIAAGQGIAAARLSAFADLCQALLSANEFVYLD